MKAEAEATTTTARRPRGGRPRLACDTVRAMTIGVRVSPAELDTLRARAAAAGLKPADLLRRAALEKEFPQAPVPHVNRMEYLALSRLSSNLNQLAHQANSGAAVTVDLVLLEQIRTEVINLGLALIGAK